MSRLLTLYNKITNLPYGHYIFSKAVTLRAPYFSAPHPMVRDLDKGYCLVEMRSHRAIRNKFGRLSYGALCTLADFTARLAIDGSVTTGLRWITRQMNVMFIKKPIGTVFAEARLDYRLIRRDKTLDVSVSIMDSAGVPMAEVMVSFYICSSQDYDLLYA